jgi:hypothetical protein
MDETDRRDWAEARLYALYERSFAQLEEDIRRLDPGYVPGNPRSFWPRKLTREAFRNYLRRPPTRNPKIRRYWVARLLLLADPREQVALREALDPALFDTQGGARGDVGDEAVDAPPVRGPHFLAKKQREPSGDGG